MLDIHYILDTLYFVLLILFIICLFKSDANKPDDIITKTFDLIISKYKKALKSWGYNPKKFT